jgi:hypothetical protein
MRLSRTVKHNNIKRLAGMYKKYENKKATIKKGKLVNYKVNRFDFRKLLTKAFKGDITFLKVKDKIIIKDNKSTKKSA